MVKYVIDTNVPVVANGADMTVSLDCRLAAVSLLRLAIANGKIYLDTAGNIQQEYRRHLNHHGQPGVGDRFYLEVLNSNPTKILRVNVEVREDGEYLDLPQAIIDAGFDPSDRVFAALAKKVGAKVYNAVDTDWLEKRDVIEANGVEICFVCGDAPRNWRVADKDD